MNETVDIGNGKRKH